MTDLMPDKMEFCRAKGKLEFILLQVCWKDRQLISYFPSAQTPSLHTDA